MPSCAMLSKTTDGDSRGMQTLSARQIVCSGMPGNGTAEVAKTTSLGMDIDRWRAVSCLLLELPWSGVYHACFRSSSSSQYCRSSDDDLFETVRVVTESRDLHIVLMLSTKGGVALLSAGCCEQATRACSKSVLAV